MSRWAAIIGFCLVAAAAMPAQTSPTPAEQDSSSNPFGLPPPFKPKEDAKSEKSQADQTQIDKSELPPEEDKGDAPRTFSFNPVQSQRELTAGDYYFKKGNYIAAVSRYDEATKWNDGNALAWKSLGEAQQKRSNDKAARAAYEKYLELSPDAKDASEIKKRLEKLKG